MSVKTASSLFMVSSLKRHVRFYQRLFNGALSFKELGNRLVEVAKHAQTFRQYEKVSEAAQTLINFPLKDYQSIGRYYLGWHAFLTGGAAGGILERASEYSPAKYRSLAMLSLAAIQAREQDYASELYWLTESLKLSPSIEALRGIAVVKAKQGHHKTSLKDFERLIPLARYSEPLHYYDFLNSYAVELGEAGRRDEAQNVIKRVIASPLAFAYPEWQETAQELRAPNRSFVAVPSIGHELVEVETAVDHHASAPEQPARLISFPKLKEAPHPQKPARVAPQEYVELTASDKRELILAALKSGAIEETHYFKIMLILGLISFGPSDKIIDLEDDEVLDDIAIMWARNIGAEEFVGFLSALRDCEDDIRLTNILDRLITKIFHETQECGLTEEEWRLRVERRLPKK